VASSQLQISLLGISIAAIILPAGKSSTKSLSTKSLSTSQSAHPCSFRHQRTTLRQTRVPTRRISRTLHMARKTICCVRDSFHIHDISLQLYRAEKKPSQATRPYDSLKVYRSHYASASPFRNRSLRFELLKVSLSEPRMVSEDGSSLQSWIACRASSVDVVTNGPYWNHNV
jgi:hypothetical protein